MQLLEYLKSLDTDSRFAFAEKCGTTSEYLFQVAYGNRIPKADLAVKIDRESGGHVPCDDLLPSVDWRYVRTSKKKSAAQP